MTLSSFLRWLIATASLSLLLPCSAQPAETGQRRATSPPARVQVPSAPLKATAPPEPVPRLQRVGNITQLLVNGKPWIALAGEVHNSTASSEAFMRPVWDRLAQLQLNTVVTPAYWELVEPREGRFDFSLVDMQIREARAHSMRLVLLWFSARGKRRVSSRTQAGA